jgi:hypothetical protein
MQHHIYLWSEGVGKNSRVFARIYPFDTDTYVTGEGFTDIEAIGSMVCRMGPESFGMEFHIVGNEPPEAKDVLTSS